MKNKYLYSFAQKLKNLRNLAVLALLGLTLAACQTTITAKDIEEAQVKVAKLTVTGDWKFEGLNNVLGVDYDKDVIVKVTKKALQTKLKELHGPRRVNVDVKIQSFFISNMGYDILFGTGASSMSGLVTVIDARTKEVIVKDARIGTAVANHEVFAEQVVAKVLRATKKP
ncbi:hypothetical protein [Pseudovibrio sp. JE062]|uniref:hypothetical protein n=1 Tax=Pseudovibrio sp. JE062 TaxID=439495 RepID=UPI000186F603|nr:hypothetical protein [Pseudovibrio sp. JE062]EEA93340.1 hypothetical protein PJE062_3740 [Pseudovibrio sp. JE062]